MDLNGIVTRGSSRERETDAEQGRVQLSSSESQSRREGQNKRGLIDINLAIVLRDRQLCWALLHPYLSPGGVGSVGKHSKSKRLIVMRKQQENLSGTMFCQTYNRPRSKGKGGGDYPHLRRPPRVSSYAGGESCA